ncbi:hypothetical protein EOM81_11460 [bacterium]|nr:hypothetical protein [bacterium]
MTISECFKSCSNFMKAGCRFIDRVESYADACSSYQSEEPLDYAELNTAYMVLRGLQKTVEDHATIDRNGRSLRLATVIAALNDAVNLLDLHKEKISK